MNKHQRQQFRIRQPYCLKRSACGRYVLFNRDYKPLGLEAQDLPGLTPRVAAELSDRGSDSVNEIYLYNDGCNPAMSATHMRAYEKRLAMLAKVQAAPSSESAAESSVIDSRPGESPFSVLGSAFEVLRPRNVVPELSIQNELAVREFRSRV